MLKEYKLHTIFIVLLLLTLYLNPNMFNELFESPLGKGLLLSFVIIIGYVFDKKAAFLASLIVVLLLQNTKEGMETMEEEKNKKEKQEEKVLSKKAIQEITNNLMEKINNEKNKDSDVAMNGGKNTGGDLLSNDLTRKQVDSKSSIVDPTANLVLPTNNTNNDLELQPEVPKLLEGFALL
jgi:hypothetical protein